MYDPYLSTSLYISLCPPEKPLQLARIMSGSCSPLLKSRIACAVLNALLGYHTPPASLVICSMESGLAGSAGVTFSTERVSTPMTPTGIPPRRARPTTTVRAQPPSASSKEFLSKRPLRKPSSVCWPAMRWRTSYGPFCGGQNVTSRSQVSADGEMGTGLPFLSGTKDIHLTILETPAMSSSAVMCETPLRYMICVPPSCRLEV